ncbi:MAG: DUF3426 domain-containing protein [Gammaproteobacteria bacterium]
MNSQETLLEPHEVPIGPWPLRVAGVVLLFALVVQLFFYGMQALSPQGALCLWWQQGCDAGETTGLPAANLRHVDFVKGTVQPHPTVAGALLISGTIVNHDLQAQRYPRLEVQFFDLAGRMKAARIFQPAEYLEHTVDRSNGMPAGEPIPVRLEVLDPGLPVPSFQFKLH